MMVPYLYPFLTSLGLSLLFTPLVRNLAYKLKIIAPPRPDRWHKKPTALLGGIGIFLAFMVSLGIFFYSNPTPEIQGLFLGSFAMFLLGLWDDCKPLKPQTKLLGQIIAVSLTIPFGVVSSYFNPLFGIPLTIFFMVAMANSFNLLDNMDGLCAGIAFITALNLFLFNMAGTDPKSAEIATLSCLIGGSTLGFLFFNFNPATIFMGDCGSLFLGFALAGITTIGSYHEVSQLLTTLMVPVMILLVPIFDTTLVTVMRTLNNRPVSQGGKDHISHRLVKLGLSEKKAVLLLYLLAFLAGSLGVSYQHFSPFSVTWLVFLFLLGFFVFGMYLGEIKVYPEKTGFTGGDLDPLDAVFFDSRVMYKRRLLEVILDSGFIICAFGGALLLKNEGVLGNLEGELMMSVLPFLIPIQLMIFDFFNFYRGLWRYTGISDALNIFKAVSTGTLATFLFFKTLLPQMVTPGISLLTIHFLLLLFFTLSLRLSYRIFAQTFQNLSQKDKNTLVVGAIDDCHFIIEQLRKGGEPFNLKGLLTSQKKWIGTLLAGVPVIGYFNDLHLFLEREEIEVLYYLKDRVSEEEENFILSSCQGKSIEVRWLEFNKKIVAKGLVGGPLTIINKDL